MDVAAIVFNAAYWDSAMESARCVVRYGRDTISRALLPSVNATREHSEYGPGATLAATLRYLSADQPRAAQAGEGDDVEVMRTGAGATTWTRYRIAYRRETGGLVTLGLADVNE